MNARIATVVCCLFSDIQLSAQTFHVIYNFSEAPSGHLQAPLLLRGDTLYGTTMGGGSFNNGAVFKVSTNGTDYTIVKSFTALDSIASTNTDGAEPMGGVVMYENRLFGTTSVGGSGRRGTIFGVNTDGTEFAVLNNFNGTNGRNPYVGLSLSGDVLYGTTAAGGISNKGAIFAIHPDGTRFNLVKNFVSNEGMLLLSGVTVNGDILYGTTYDGGVSNRGTIYSINTNGDEFAVLKIFAGDDGTQPRYSLVLSGDTLYGVTDGNGVNSNSVVYRMKTDGTGYRVIKRFSEPAGPNGTNSDGSNLCGGMALWHGVLYGTANWGGVNGNGVIFKVNPDGSGFAVLKHFSPVTGTSGGNFLNADGMHPVGDLIVADGILYGTTQYGGSYGCGTIYSLTLPAPPALQITNRAGHPLIFWSDDGLNRTLRTTPDLASGNWTNIASLNWTNTFTLPQQIGYQVAAPFNSTGAFYSVQ